MSPIVGSPLARVDGHAKVTGAATYTADTEIRGALHGFLVLSTVANGRVTGIDVRDAERSPGVVAVFTHRNMPELVMPTAQGTVYWKRVVPLQDTDIHHSGQPVAYVVAENLDQILPPPAELPATARAGLEALSAMAVREPLERRLDEFPNLLPD